MFGLRCKSCDAKEQELKELKALLEKMQMVNHINSGWMRHQSRQLHLLSQENPAIWKQYFSKDAKRFRGAREQLSDIHS